MHYRPKIIRATKRLNLHSFLFLKVDMLFGDDVTPENFDDFVSIGPSVLMPESNKVAELMHSHSGISTVILQRQSLSTTRTTNR